MEQPLREVLLNFAIKYNFDFDKMFTAIKNKETVKEQDKAVLNNLDGFLTIIDEQYPLRLKCGFTPPIVLLYKGDLTLLEKDLVYAYPNNNIGYNKPYVEALADKVVIKENLKSNKTLELYCKTPIKVAVALANKIVITSLINDTDLKLLGMNLENKDVYVIPTTTPSVNNQLIKNGAYLYDSLMDLE